MNRKQVGNRKGIRFLRTNHTCYMIPLDNRSPPLCIHTRHYIEQICSYQTIGKSLCILLEVHVVIVITCGVVGPHGWM